MQRCSGGTRPRVHHKNTGARAVSIYPTRALCACARGTRFFPLTTAYGYTPSKDSFFHRYTEWYTVIETSFGAFKSDDDALRTMPLLPVTTKLSESEIEFLDSMVSKGEARSRSDAIRTLVLRSCPVKMTGERPRTVNLDIAKARALSQKSSSKPLDSGRLSTPEQTQIFNREMAAIRRF